MSGQTNRIFEAVRNHDETDTFDPVVSVSITLANGAIWTFNPDELQSLVIRERKHNG